MLELLFQPTVILLAFVATLLVMAVVGYRAGRRRSKALVRQGHRLRATPDYFGWYVLVWMFGPPVLITIGAAVVEYSRTADAWGYWLAAVWIVLPVLALGPAVTSIRPQLDARVPVERTIYLILLCSALVSILTTLGILLSVVFESWRFFEHPDVTVGEFLFGTTWSPGGAFLESAGRGGEERSDARFGAVPLFAGTLMFTGIAMLVAVPIGLMAAIYLSEYAAWPVRKVGKPLLEVLAGIPTVVYGFFAAITVTPVLVDTAHWFGLDASYQNALAPGAIMGVMIIPFMSSLCDDVMRSVPQNIRRASYALGATRSETIMRVVLPVALPGIVSAFLLAVSRAIGETMIVVMAAGLTANLTLNPLQEMTTVTVHIVDSLTGDQAYDNPQTLSAFGLGLTLLILTLILNVISLVAIRSFRRHYEGD